MRYRDGRKSDVQAANRRRRVLDVQNGLYHLSAHSPRYVMTDTDTGAQVTPLRWVGRLTYEVREEDSN
jgi:hypothetical protein